MNYQSCFGRGKGKVQCVDGRNEGYVLLAISRLVRGLFHVGGVKGAYQRSRGLTK